MPGFFDIIELEVTDMFDKRKRQERTYLKSREQAAAEMFRSRQQSVKSFYKDTRQRVKAFDKEIADREAAQSPASRYFKEEEEGQRDGD